MRIDLVEGWAIRNHRKNVREAMQYYGEEVLVLRMFHSVTDAETAERCPDCYDDVYKQGETNTCTTCYGTTFRGGVHRMLRCWAVFTTNPNDEKRDRRGEWQSDNRQVQFEASLDVSHNDYVIRVREWTPEHAPLELAGRYSLGVVTDESLRTGTQFAQDDADRVGQRAPVTLLTEEHVIYRYPIPVVPVPLAEDLPAPWVRVPVWFYGSGPPTVHNTRGADFGDGYLDVDTGTDYVLTPDNAEPILPGATVGRWAARA